MSYVIGGLTTAAAILAFTSGIPAQTLKAPNYSAIAGAFARFSQPLFAIHPAFKDALDEMSGYKSLTSGWDGIDSVPPREEIIDGAISFLAALPYDAPAPEASVSADGGVSWFWNNGKVYATVSFSKLGSFVYFAKNKETLERVRGTGVLDNSVPQDLLDVLRAA